MGDVWVCVVDSGAAGDAADAAFLGPCAAAAAGGDVGGDVVWGDGDVDSREGYLAGRHTLPLQLGVAWVIGVGVCGMDKADALVDELVEEEGGVGSAAGVDAMGALAVCVCGVRGVFDVIARGDSVGEPPLEGRFFVKEAAEWVAAHARRDVVVCDREEVGGVLFGA